MPDSVAGKCNCAIPWTGPDCSTRQDQAPYVTNIPGYGFCDIERMDCGTVVVYGQDFVNSSALTCYLEEVRVVLWICFESEAKE